MGTEFEGDIVGIVTTGDATDQQILYPLDASPKLVMPIEDGKPAEAPVDLDRIEIAARTRPEDAFARKDPDTLSPKQHELWYCRPYANSIAYQIREAIPNSDAQQVRRVEQSEGNVLSRISGLMALIAAAALLAAGFAVSAAMATAVLERRAEIGLMRSLGASRGSIALLFYVEAAILALVSRCRRLPRRLRPRRHPRCTHLPRRRPHPHLQPRPPSHRRRPRPPRRHRRQHPRHPLRPPPRPLGHPPVQRMMPSATIRPALRLAFIRPALSPAANLPLSLLVILSPAKDPLLHPAGRLSGCPILSRSHRERVGYRLRKQTTALLPPPTDPHA